MAGYVKLLVYCDEDEIVEENSDEPVSQVFSLRLCRAGKLPSALRYQAERHHTVTLACMLNMLFFTPQVRSLAEHMFEQRRALSFAGGSGKHQVPIQTAV